MKSKDLVQSSLSPLLSKMKFTILNQPNIISCVEEESWIYLEA